MPAAAERCVQSLMAKGHEESAAWAICQAALKDCASFGTDACCMNKGTTDSSSNVPRMQFDRQKIIQHRMTDEGYLVVEGARLARTGIQEYLAIELGTPDGFSPFDVIRVYRPREEVFRKESLDSFRLKPVTNDHPPVMLTRDNVRQFQVGSVGDNLAEMDEHMVATLIITDQQAIKSIEAGKVELSNGYFSDYVWEKGVTPDGLQYDAKQVNIRGNHVALVESGRCGGSCRVLDSIMTSDNSGSRVGCNCGGHGMTEVTLKVAGIDTKMPEQAAQVVQKYMNDCEAKIVSLEQELTSGAEKHAGVVDALRAELEEAKKSVLTVEQLDAKVAERQALVSKVTSIDKDFDWKGKSEAEIVRGLVVKKFPSEDLQGKSDEYMRARFDVLSVTTAATGDAMDDALRNAHQGKDVPNADKAREDFCARTRTAYLNTSKSE